MHITEMIETKIERLKNNPETMYAGVDFENQYKEKLKDLEVLNQEIDKATAEN
ncbi:hypothetical protein [Planomicrobium okeanokoites]|uniref:Uncharacterized protein n=1 Tax=Planomicrobium okeanokoites TaxID=244 RepID=A0ABV7KMM0_PLAOK|nr:hypothetical protein [Planomicrobium okeanokoites]